MTWGEYLWRDIGESQRACLHVERKRPLFMCCVLSLCAASNLCNECVLSAQRRYVSVSSLVGLDRPSCSPFSPARWRAQSAGSRRPPPPGARVRPWPAAPDDDDGDDGDDVDDGIHPKYLRNEYL